ncbi:hypothetical protein [Thiomonas sp.]|jgi:hypothetical protein|uniref:hypothetical protein n=1 Tax=Thiomonas sp. TaxID=2047785 RepID=UPI0025908039|nr:hypothetical protein [Thiomonas sp.]
MAASIREQILQALAAKLQTVATAGGAQFFRQPVLGIPREQSPALTLDVHGEAIDPRGNSLVDRHLTVRVIAIARNLDVSAGYTQADALIVAAHAAIMADLNVGGLAQALREEACDWQEMDADAAVAMIPATYVVQYRTRTTDLTTATPA